ncbi:MAG: hypothetical protein RL499_534 [Actinomycetota bacterium]
MTNRSGLRARRAVALATLTTLVVAGSGYFAFAGLAPVEPIPATTSVIASVTTPPASVSLPGEGGAAIAARDTEQVFASRDLDTPRALASITKVITALVVLETYPIAEGAPGASITLTAADSALPARYLAMNGSVAPAPAGTVVTQRQVIELMMVRSANNYAETLAVWAFGSTGAYLDAAREWLAKNDLDGITVGDSTGFSLANTGTPRELIELARIALDNEVIATAVAKPSVTVAGVGTFETTNLALGLAGVNGIKTGTLDGIGANLLFSSTITVADTTTDVVGVVLGLDDQESVAAAVTSLVTSATDDFFLVSLVEPGTVVATYTAPWGDTARLVTAETEPVLVWGPGASRTAIEAPPLIVGNDRLPRATLVVSIGAQRQSIPLQWEGTIDSPPLLWKLTQPIDELVAG